jgi:glucose-6-phosphate dehydrogenase assembly protein OpcA
VEKRLMPTTIQPDRILHELSELWVSLGKQHGDESAGGVLRACAMTLVVVAEAQEDTAEVGETLALLMREHPSRAVVVRVRDDEAPELESRVFAQCWMPFGQRRQICCEQIEISTSNSSLVDVPAVVLPLVVADLPVVLWFRPLRLLGSPALKGLEQIATKTVIDSAAFPDPKAALQRLAHASTSGTRLGDLAWTRLTRWRELIAQIFENPAYFSHLPSFTQVTISHPPGTPPVGARYMAAWLRLCLELAGSKAGVRWAPADEAGDGGLSGVEFSSSDPSVLNASVRKVEGSAAEVRVNSLVNRTVFPEASDYVLLREELSISGADPVFEKTLALAAGLEES